MFRSSELVRLLGMVVLLAVLSMAMVRARDPAMWKWLAARDGERATLAAVATPPSPPAPLPPNPPAGKAPALAVTGEERKIDPADSATDLNPDQRADAREEFLVVRDGSMGIQSEEMFAYYRLLTWTENQSFEDLRGRPAQRAVMAELQQSPSKYRGRLISLTLNIRRVLAYDVQDMPIDATKLYEMWGFSDESGAWLYSLVTAHLPPGMSLGTAVEERVRFVGYFFKLQGYLEAGAKPRAKPLRAPLLVGRIERIVPPSVRPSSNFDGLTLAMLGGIAVIIAAALVGHYAVVRRGRSRPALPPGDVPQVVRQWLDHEAASPDTGAPSDVWHPPGTSVEQGPSLEHKSEVTS